MSNQMGIFGGLFGRKKPAPDFSGVTGGGSTTAPAGAPRPGAGKRTYTVVSGDSLENCPA